METLAAHAAAIAERARNHARQAERVERSLDRVEILREWWTVTLPSGGEVDLFCWPPQSAREVGARYPACRALES